MAAVDTLEVLTILGSAQWGLVTSAQAGNEGVSRVQLSRLANRGTIQRIRHGVYALPSAAGSHMDLCAAWLGVEPASLATSRRRSTDPVVVTGVSAATVWGLSDVIPQRHEFSSSSRRQSRSSDVAFRRRWLRPSEWTTSDGIPITTPLQTVIDLAESAIDDDNLATMVSSACDFAEVSTVALAKAIEPRASRHNYPSAHAYLEHLFTKAGEPPSVTRAKENLEQTANLMAQLLFETLATNAPEIDTSVLLQSVRHKLADKSSSHTTNGPAGRAAPSDAAAHQQAPPEPRGQAPQ